MGGLIIISIVLMILAMIYLTVTTGRCKSDASLVGKTTIITGGDSGIGYATAMDFAKRGAKLIMASSEDEKLGDMAAERIIKRTSNPNIYFKHMDLSSLKSVRKFAEEINGSEKRLDILVNNAGVLDIPHRETEDGLQILMQINYFGPFLLTMLLLNDIDLNNLNDIPRGNMGRDVIFYSRSKLCIILFTIALADKLKNTTVTAYSVHPGPTKTSIIRNQSLIMRFLRYLEPFVTKSPYDGAQTTIYCSITEGIEHLSGQHFHDCRLVKRYKTAEDTDLQKDLWKVTETLLSQVESSKK